MEGWMGDWNGLIDGGLMGDWNGLIDGRIDR